MQPPAHVHLDKAALYLASGHALHRSMQFLHAVDVEFPVAVCRGLGGSTGVHHAVGHRVEPVYLGIKAGEGLVLAVGNLDLLPPQPLVDIVKVEHRVDAVRVARVHASFFLWRSGAEEHHPFTWLPALFSSSRGRSWGNHRRQVRNQLRVVDLDQIVDAGTAGGDNVLHPALAKQLCIFRGHKAAPRRSRTSSKPRRMRAARTCPMVLYFKSPHIGGRDETTTRSPGSYVPLHFPGRC